MTLPVPSADFNKMALGMKRDQQKFGILEGKDSPFLLMMVIQTVNGEGQNNLGKLLMKIREEYKNKN